MPGRNHSREFKPEGVGQINAGVRASQHCRGHSPAPALIRCWRKDVKECGEAASPTLRGGLHRPPRGPPPAPDNLIGRGLSRPRAHRQPDGFFT